MIQINFFSNYILEYISNILGYISFALKYLLDTYIYSFISFFLTDSFISDRLRFILDIFKSLLYISYSLFLYSIILLLLILLINFIVKMVNLPESNIVNTDNKSSRKRKRNSNEGFNNKDLVFSGNGNGNGSGNDNGNGKDNGKGNGSGNDNGKDKGKGKSKDNNNYNSPEKDDINLIMRIEKEKKELPSFDQFCKKLNKSRSANHSFYLYNFWSDRLKLEYDTLCYQFLKSRITNPNLKWDELIDLYKCSMDVHPLGLISNKHEWSTVERILNNLTNRITLDMSDRWKLVLSKTDPEKFEIYMTIIDLASSAK